MSEKNEVEREIPPIYFFFLFFATDILLTNKCLKGHKPVFLVPGNWVGKRLQVSHRKQKNAQSKIPQFPLNWCFIWNDPSKPRLGKQQDNGKISRGLGYICGLQVNYRKWFDRDDRRKVYNCFGLVQLFMFTLQPTNCFGAKGWLRPKTLYLPCRQGTAIQHSLCSHP